MEEASTFERTGRHHSLGGVLFQLYQIPKCNMWRLGFIITEFMLLSGIISIEDRSRLNFLGILFLIAGQGVTAISERMCVQ